MIAVITVIRSWLGIVGGVITPLTAPQLRHRSGQISVEAEGDGDDHEFVDLPRDDHGRPRTTDAEAEHTADLHTGAAQAPTLRSIVMGHAVRQRRLDEGTSRIVGEVGLRQAVL